MPDPHTPLGKRYEWVESWALLDISPAGKAVVLARSSTEAGIDAAAAKLFGGPVEWRDWRTVPGCGGPLWARSDDDDEFVAVDEAGQPRSVETDGSHT